MHLLLALLAALWLPAQYIADLDLTTLSFDAEAFREAFNSASDRPRLVTVMSPT